MYSREELIKHYEDILNIFLMCVPYYGRKGIKLELVNTKDPDNPPSLERIEQYIKFLVNYGLIDFYELKDRESKIWTFDFNSDLIIFYTRHIEDIDEFFMEQTDHKKLKIITDKLFRMNQGEHCPHCCIKDMDDDEEDGEDGDGDNLLSSLSPLPPD